MENLFLTSLTTPEIRQLFRQELETFFESNKRQDANAPLDEQPVNAKELCAFLNITEPTLIRWRNKGKVPFLKIGSRLLYQKTAVLSALNQTKERGRR